MIKHVLGSYVFPFGLYGLGVIMPEDTVTKIWIGYSCFIVAGLIFCWAVFKDIKNYFQKRNKIEIKEEPLLQKTLKRSVPDGYIQDEKAGWLRNPKTDEIFCLKCWYEKNIATPLIKDNDIPAGWICPRCKKTYISLSRMFMNSFFVRYCIANAKQQPKKKSFFNRK